MNGCIGNDAPVFFVPFRRLFISLASLLLALIVVQCAGYIAFHQWWLMKHRRSMERAVLSQLPDSLFTRITLCTGDAAYWDRFAWEEEGKEFRYNGALFDLVRMEHRTDDSITFIAVQDEEEEHLLGRFNDLVERSLSKDGSPDDIQDVLTASSTWTYLAAATEVLPITYCSTVAYRITDPPSSIHRSLSVSTPPPERSRHI